MLPWLAAAALAQEVVDPFEEADESVLFRFEEELVTVASRYAQTVRKAPSIVTLVTADQIRERGYRTVSEVLRELPGIYVWKSPEGRDLVAIRGVIAPDNNKLLVLVDGVPWYEGVYTHGFVDDFLPISNIRQIEVIKGPGSAIYGTNAFAGVVNIVTWGPQDLEGARARVLGGSTTRGDVTIGAGGRGRIGRTETSAVAWVRLFGQTGQGLDVNPELAFDVPGTDPKKAVNVGVKLAAAGLRLQVAHVDYAHTYLSNEIEDPFEAQARTLDTFDLEYHDTFVDVRYLFEPRDVQIAPYAFYQRHDNPSSYFFGGDITVDPVSLEASQFFMTVDAEKTTERTGGGLDVQARPALDHVVVGGAGVETVRVLRLFDLGIPAGGDPFVLNDFAVTNDCGDPAGFYTNREDCVPPRLRNLFGYVQYTWTTTPFLELTAGGRVDKRTPVNRNEEGLGDEGAFVLAVSPRVGALLVPTDDLTVKLLYGRAFRSPSVRELLVTVAPDPTTGEYPFTSGDLDVLPETIDTTEGEVTAAVAEGFEVRADASWSVLIDEIDKVGGRYCNLPGNLNVLGLEAGLKARRGRVSAQADYALTRAQYVDEDGDAICTIPDPYGGKAQYEFPPHMLKGSLRVAITEELSATLFGEAYAARPRAAWSPDARNPDGAAFGLLHASMRAAGIGDDDRVELDLAVRNVLGSEWNTGVYRDEANDDGTPGAVQGEGRAVTVGIEIAL